MPPYVVSYHHMPLASNRHTSQELQRIQQSSCCNAPSVDLQALTPSCLFPAFVRCLPSARSRAAPQSSRASPQVNNYSTTIVAAPPVYSSFSPFGFGGFGFGGVRIMPVFPFPFFGGLLQFMFLVSADRDFRNSSIPAEVAEVSSSSAAVVAAEAWALLLPGQDAAAASASCCTSRLALYLVSKQLLVILCMKLCCTAVKKYLQSTVLLLTPLCLAAAVADVDCGCCVQCDQGSHRRSQRWQQVKEPGLG